MRRKANKVRTEKANEVNKWLVKQTPIILLTTLVSSKYNTAMVNLCNHSVKFVYYTKKAIDIFIMPIAFSYSNLMID